MKKIITSLGMIVFVAAIVVGGTGAFFSDTETSTGNTFAAGDIDLQIDNTSYVTSTSTGLLVASPVNTWAMSNLTNQLFFSFTDVKPGDIGEDTISIHPGSNDAYACMAADITSTPDNGINEPEGDADDVTDGPTGGELQNFLNFSFWEDDGDNVFEDGEVLLPDLQGTAATIFDGGWNTIADSGNGPALPGGSTTYVGKAWCFGTLTPNATTQDGNGSSTPITRGTTGFICDGSGDNNIAQTDGITVDVSFYAVQARNNGQFSCSSLPPFVGRDGGGEPEPEVLVGAVLGDYVAPAVCSDTVSTTESIQASEDAAASNATICVDATYDGTGDNTAIRIEKVGITLAATAQGVNLDVPVVLSASNVTVTGFDGVIGQAASPAEQAAFYVEADGDLFEISFNTVVGGVGAAILTETGGALGGGLITNNVLSGATQGIYTNPHTGVFTIEYNDIDNNVAGIGGLMGATVRNNEFEHTVASSEAIGVDTTYNANPTSVEFNNFLNGTMLNTYVGPIIPDVDAENNFWGPSGGAVQTGGTDEVDFTPEAGVAYAHN